MPYRQPPSALEWDAQTVVLKENIYIKNICLIVGEYIGLSGVLGAMPILKEHYFVILKNYCVVYFHLFYILVLHDHYSINLTLMRTNWLNQQRRSKNLKEEEIKFCFIKT